MTTQPHWYHQRVIGKLFSVLDAWSETTRHGQVSQAPGVIFDEENAVAPDVVWASHERLEILLDDAGHLRGTPELVVEVLSPGLRNEERDRSAKLKLYSTRGVLEYWIANWRLKTIEVYRREGATLRLAVTLQADDELTSPQLPGFSARVGTLFE